MKKFVSFLGILGVLGIGSLAYGNEVTVYPGGATYTTIQAGVNACPVDGIVSVSAGTYTEAVYIKKRIALVGVGTPTINPPTDGAAVTFDGKGADGASISGFKIEASGEGIYCCHCSPTIKNNIIKGMFAIFCDYSSPDFSGNEIAGITLLYCSSTNIVVEENDNKIIITNPFLDE